MRDEMAKSGVKIVAGDTKVVPRGGVDGLFINTAGIGEIMCENISLIIWKRMMLLSSPMKWEITVRAF